MELKSENIEKFIKKEKLLKGSISLSIQVKLSDFWGQTGQVKQQVFI